MAPKISPLKYYADGRDVYLSHAEKYKPAKYICAAESSRLAKKIASHMNLMESRAEKAHEIYMK